MTERHPESRNGEHPGPVTDTHSTCVPQQTFILEHGGPRPVRSPAGQGMCDCCEPQNRCGYVSSHSENGCRRSGLRTVSKARPGSAQHLSGVLKPADAVLCERRRRLHNANHAQPGNCVLGRFPRLEQTKRCSLRTASARHEIVIRGAFEASRLRCQRLLGRFRAISALP